MGRGEKSLLCDPGSELRIQVGGREKKGEENEVSSISVASPTTCVCTSMDLIRTYAEGVLLFPFLFSG